MRRVTIPARVLGLLLALAACADPAPPPTTAALVAPPPPPGEVEAGAGGVVYVPAYSSVLVRDGEQSFDLTVTLSIRNTDEQHPLSVERARFFDKSGKLLQDYAKEPVVLGPLASAETVVPESDTRAGLGGSFVVDWRAPEGAREPVIEAVMVGSAGGQGISFVSAGRAVAKLPPR